MEGTRKDLHLVNALFRHLPDSLSLTQYVRRTLSHVASSPPSLPLPPAAASTYPLYDPQHTARRGAHELHVSGRGTSAPHQGHLRQRIIVPPFAMS